MNFPTVTLKNGLVVVNFSSNHAKFNPNSDAAFTFDDGSKLENCSLPDVQARSLKMKDTKELSVCGRFSNIRKEFVLTETIIQAVAMLELDDETDIIIVPFPMLQALAAKGSVGKCRTVSGDRATGICSSTEFCTM